MTDPKSKSKPALNRREFLGSSARNAAQAAAGVVGLSQVNRLQAKSSVSRTEKVRLGFVGLRNQGASLLKSFQQLPDSQIVSLCDIDLSVQNTAMQSIDRSQHSPELCDDFRRMLDSSQVDAVVIATPDHHHAWMAAMACDAGKDVYLEAPTTHTLLEGVQLQQMISRTKSIVQVGLQQRSGLHFQSAVDFLHSGQLGKVYQSRAWSSIKRQPLRSVQPSASQHLSAQYNSSAQHSASFPEIARLAWLGEEKNCSLHPQDWHYHWRWLWGFGSGELGNWGVHLLDVARWGLNVALPQRVIATGSCGYFNDARETPEAMNVMYDYGDQSITWEHRQWSSRGIEGRAHGVAFYGERGTLILDRSGWKVYDHTPAVSAPASELRLSHANSFLQSVRDRTEPAANFEAGNLSTQLCHLGNLAYQQKRELRLDPNTATILPFEDSVT